MRAAGSVIVVAALVLAAGCGARGSGPAEKTVRRFVDAMMKDDQAALGAMISPAWLEANGVDVEACAVNALSPVSYKIEAVNDREVTVKVKYLLAASRLVFRVVEEEGRYYIEPGGLGPQGWIEPWVTLERLAE